MLESLFDRPIVSVAEAQVLSGTTYTAANPPAAHLVGLGTLKEVTDFARNRRFRYEPFVRLFTEEREEDA